MDGAEKKPETWYITMTEDGHLHALFLGDETIARLREMNVPIFQGVFSSGETARAALAFIERVIGSRFLGQQIEPLIRAIQAAREEPLS